MFSDVGWVLSVLFGQRQKGQLKRCKDQVCPRTSEREEAFRRMTMLRNLPVDVQHSRHSLDKLHMPEPLHRKTCNASLISHNTSLLLVSPCLVARGLLSPQHTCEC